MGKWFDATDEEKENALKMARKKKLLMFEILEKNQGTRRYYVGEKLPQKIVQDINKGRVHALKLWYPTA